MVRCTLTSNERIGIRACEVLLLISPVVCVVQWCVCLFLACFWFLCAFVLCVCLFFVFVVDLDVLGGATANGRIAIRPTSGERAG